MKVGIGQDSHRFVDFDARAGAAASPGAGELPGAGHGAVPGEGQGAPARPLLLGGVAFSGCPPLEGNSDADVVLHALCNAISGVTGVNVLGEAADRMCRAGVTDSAEYVREALRHMGAWRLCHVSVSIECARPKIAPQAQAMRESIARIAGLEPSCVGVTATSGEGLTDVGRGLGIAATCVATALPL
jgi:2-C-methyl-D-erythritol 2,4-cyclodiphosphate synthase